MRNLETSNRNRYRSVKYKLTRDHSLSAQYQSTQKKLPYPSTTKNTNFKHHKYSNGFSAMNLTGTKIQKVDNEECPEQTKYQRSTYVDSFHSLLSMQKNRHNRIQKQKQKAEQQSSGIKKQSRVLLPTLNQLDSHFTVLDNINLPIIYLHGEIQRLKGELKSDNIEMRLVAQSLRQIKSARVKQIQQITNIGSKGLERLNILLRKVRTNHQQSILRTKNSFDKCIDYIPNYLEKLDETKGRINQLQDTIFKGKPFQLEQREEYKIMSNDYF